LEIKDAFIIAAVSSSAVQIGSAGSGLQFGGDSHSGSSSPGRFLFSQPSVGNKQFKWYTSNSATELMVLHQNGYLSGNLGLSGSALNVNNGKVHLSSEGRGDFAGSVNVASGKAFSVNGTTVVDSNGAAKVASGAIMTSGGIQTSGGQLYIRWSTELFSAEGINRSGTPQYVISGSTSGVGGGSGPVSCSISASWDLPLDPGDSSAWAVQVFVNGLRQRKASSSGGFSDSSADYLLYASGSNLVVNFLYNLDADDVVTLDYIDQG